MVSLGCLDSLPYPLLLLVLLLPFVHSAVPKFESVSISHSSYVIRLINGENVALLDMAVHIYDLDRLEEFRKTELRSENTNDLFAFDGLRPSTWFAFRVHYRVLFVNLTEGDDFVTKQELVVRTKAENSALSENTVEDVVTLIDESFVTTADLYVSIRSVFSAHTKVMTVVVPELRCPGRGVVKPLAQQVAQNARLHFDLSALGEEARLADCETVCLFPFLRVALKNRTSETFRAREWCGSLDRVMQLGHAKAVATSSTAKSRLDLIYSFSLSLCVLAIVVL